MLVDVNLRFLKHFFRSLRGISKNNPYNIKHKNKLVKFPILFASKSILLKINPIAIAVINIIGSSFSIKFIRTPF